MSTNIFDGLEDLNDIDYSIENRTIFEEEPEKVKIYINFENAHVIERDAEREGVSIKKYAEDAVKEMVELRKSYDITVEIDKKDYEWIKKQAECEKVTVEKYVKDLVFFKAEQPF